MQKKKNLSFSSAALKCKWQKVVPSVGLTGKKSWKALEPSGLSRERERVPHAEQEGPGSAFCSRTSSPHNVLNETLFPQM